MAFDYKEIDTNGQKTLDVLCKADKLNFWMYQTIQPFCKGNILEIGSGVGNISQFFVNNKQHITVSDIRENYRVILKDKFNLSNNKILNLDIADTNFDTEYAHLLGTFDSIFCLNVVEHIKDDNLAIINMQKLLQPNGNLVVLVPAYQKLYNGFDVALEHFKRYNKTTLTTLMQPHTNLQKVFYFNAVGILGWWLFGSVLKQKNIQEGELGLYNFFVPIIKIIDKILGNKIGLSVVAVAKK